MRHDHEALIHGVGIDSRPGCAHWRTPLDLIAIRFPCCGDYYACHACHQACAGHPPQRWERGRRDEPDAVLCRACGHGMSVAVYMACDARCPACAAAFNPGCRKHWDLYFVMEEEFKTWRPGDPDKAI